MRACGVGGLYMYWGVGLCYGSYSILQISKAKWIFKKKNEILVVFWLTIVSLLVPLVWSPVCVDICSVYCGGQRRF